MPHSYIYIYIYRGGVYIIENYLFKEYIIIIVIIEVFKNKLLIDNIKGHNGFEYFNRCIGLTNSCFGGSYYFLRYEKNGYRYMIGYNEKYYQIVKSTLLTKKRIVNITNIKYIIMYYSYFIYIKYYRFSNIKNYIIESITSRKLFNCRDYYKIYSFI